MFLFDSVICAVSARLRAVSEHYRLKPASGGHAQYNAVLRAVKKNFNKIKAVPSAD